MNRVKVDFPLRIREDGFPPISVETLNGELLENGRVKIDNTPFFVEGIALGDIAEVWPPSSDSNYMFDRVIEEGSSKSISVILIVDEVKEELYQKLKSMGCYCEYGEFPGYNMLAIEVSSEVNVEHVVDHLSKMESQGLISFAELCI